jgi:hypothetical protein
MSDTQDWGKQTPASETTLKTASCRPCGECISHSWHATDINLNWSTCLPTQFISLLRPASSKHNKYVTSHTLWGSRPLGYVGFKSECNVGMETITTSTQREVHRSRCPLACGRSKLGEARRAVPKLAERCCDTEIQATPTFAANILCTIVLNRLQFTYAAHLDWGYSWFYLVPPSECWDNTLN